MDDERAERIKSLAAQIMAAMRGSNFSDALLALLVALLGMLETIEQAGPPAEVWPAFDRLKNLVVSFVDSGRETLIGTNGH